MTKEDIAECIKVMQAYVEGKQKQYVDSETEDWADIESPIWNWDTYDYRIKPEPEYRPFKNADECWQEMLKHQPFGWVKRKCNKPSYELLACISENNENNEAPVCFASYGSVDRGVVIRSSSRFDKMFNVFTFADGAPFGAKEE
jgi:hypothetical protein|nr:MAG TPA: hypothetical protein [Caudoviricetes sp.]